ncbi:MAG: indolepyruvate ferredoxin oxidoreductase family protein [Hyphomicrobiaceae bacterium]
MPSTVSLADKYDVASGRIFLTGVQALVRLPIMQRQRDQTAGLNTAGFVSGYRGSPLATYDMQLMRAKSWLDAHHVRFQPGLNEELALTSVWGTQQAEARGEGRYDGVFALWYGKGAGTDRSGDAFRHGNNAGSSRHGGVLCLLGDDHRAESSSAVHASEHAMLDYMIPVLNPADVQEILEYGLIGIAMSRFTGSWVGLKCNHDVVESAASIEVDPARAMPILPSDSVIPPGGLNLRVPDSPLAQEARLHDFRIPAIKAFCRANGLDRVVFRPDGARIGIITTGKTVHDITEALGDFGIGAARAKELGLALYKVAVPWPLEPEGLRAFCDGLETIVCIEEKRAIVEPQVKELLFGHPTVRQVAGKLDLEGKPLFPAKGILTSGQIARAIGGLLVAIRPDAGLQRKLDELDARTRSLPLPPVPMDRKPYFCSGCPHNRSTVLPEGSLGGAGTGCNYMAQWMDRRQNRYTQMGADGANWIGEAPFSKRAHMFQNMGDGTYVHSGLLAIRATIAANVNITYKILYNDAVAMTGGQPHDAPLSVPMIARQVLDEGAKRVVVVADDPARYGPSQGLPQGVTLHPRAELDEVQRELRDIPGVTVLIYDQMCATERRRRRKRGLMPESTRRAFINHLVCEGCGDCGVKSNCVSILPRETALGRKRRIDQHSCNTDLSCTEGFCPSFVTVEGGRLKTPAPASDIARPPLPEPALPVLARPYNIVLSGVGGTGVVTVSSILGMAAHIDGKRPAMLDMMGLAQKGGAVTSHIRIAAAGHAGIAARVAEGNADLVIGADIMSVVGIEPISTIGRGTKGLVNTAEVLPGDFTRDPDLQFPVEALRLRLEATGADITYLAATELAEQAVGDTVATNLLMLGAAWQRGLLPLSRASIVQAISLNGVAVDASLAAFEAGRHAAVLAGEPRSEKSAPDAASELRDARDLHRRLLSDYQDDRYAALYAEFVDRVEAAEQRAVPGATRLTLAVARNLGKLMAIKDEYEVARLLTSDAFRRDLEGQFEGDYRLHYHLAPPLLARRDPLTGEPRKQTYGPWLSPVLKLVAKLKRLRGSVFDVFGWTEERRRERRLISDYRHRIEQVLDALTPSSHMTAVQIAELPSRIRGFGHVKERSIAAANARESELMADFQNNGTPARDRDIPALNSVRT